MFTNWISPLISDLPTEIRFLVFGIALAAVVMFRYSIFTAAGFGFGMLVNKFSPHRRLQRRPFSKQQVQRELFHSFTSVFVFTLVIGAIILMTRAGWTKVYTDPYEHGWVWFWLQIPFALFVQDWYFYWMHRFAHSPTIYDRVHRTHHLSTNPSAFAAFAFHPLEALLEIAIFIPLVLIVPMSGVALLIVGAVSLTFNVYGHLGYEVMPRFLAKGPVGYWLNKSTFHNQHHRVFKYNYGLYTIIWDRIYGTLHPQADRLYDQATLKPLPTSSHSNEDAVRSR
jgi:sterol desaturase/sphingolipid hydroxylase (fatty acid hydroxylase superfamily)